jgi:hypothetical protein
MVKKRFGKRPCSRWKKRDNFNMNGRQVMGNENQCSWLKLVPKSEFHFQQCRAFEFLHNMSTDIGFVYYKMPVTVAARSKAWTVFLARTLESWVRIPFEVWISVWVYTVFVLFCAGSGLASGWSSVQGVLPTVYRIKELKKRPRSARAVEP